MVRKNALRTFENNSIVWHPDVAKCPHFPIIFKKHHTRPIYENTDLRMRKTIDWADFKVARIVPWQWGKIRGFVEMRVLLESKTFLVLESAKVPKNFR
jgi:hypothetical protein